ncbi:hypothetical protein CCR95_22695 [Thiocystis minor]|uniref:hypothetical protein n=1 Tax=Thiocystis minor TaxID=61597 RepID=UPI001911862A|nr:hypothetical protein [Thiocystis minor]MBK5966805.1 hypothetical protein [Thiocystis minor]
MTLDQDTRQMVDHLPVNDRIEPVDESSKYMRIAQHIVNIQNQTASAPMFVSSSEADCNGKYAYHPERGLNFGTK